MACSLSTSECSCATTFYAILTVSETLSPPTIELSCIRGLLTLCPHTCTHMHSNDLT